MKEDTHKYSLEDFEKIDLIKEIKRLRNVLKGIVDDMPHHLMDIDKNPELVKWICDTCSKARTGMYPPTEDLTKK